MARISAVKRRNAWRRALREVGVLFVAFGLGDFAFTIFKGNVDEPLQVLQALFLAIFLNVAGLLAINYSIKTEEEEMGDETYELSLEDNAEPQTEVREPESRDSMGLRLKGAFDESLAVLTRRNVGLKIRKTLLHLAHPRRHPSSRH
jgi:hypothetical protein